MKIRMPISRTNSLTPLFEMKQNSPGSEASSPPSRISGVLFLTCGGILLLAEVFLFSQNVLQKWASFSIVCIVLLRIACGGGIAAVIFLEARILLHWADISQQRWVRTLRIYLAILCTILDISLFLTFGHFYAFSLALLVDLTIKLSFALLCAIFVYSSMYGVKVTKVL